MTTNIEFLMYSLHMDVNFNPVCTYHLDPDTIQAELDLDNFINYTGDLKRLMHVEESIFYRTPLPIPELTATQLELLSDVYWVFDVNSGAYPSHVLNEFLKLIHQFNIAQDKVILIANSEHEVEYFQNLCADWTTKPKCVCTHGNELIAIREYLQSNRSKRFMFMSRNFNPMRLSMFLDLKMRNLLKNSYYSFYHIENPYRPYPYDYRTLEDIDSQFKQYILDVNTPWKKRMVEYWEENKHNIFNQLPYTLHGETEELDGKIGQQLITSSLSRCFSDSYMSLVVETNFQDNDLMFQPTEKIARTMIYKHPFLVYSNTHFLSRFKRYGYKTFSPLLNEEYDTMTVGFDRIKAIGDEAERLNNLSYADFKKLMYNLNDVVNYNHSVIQDKLNNFSNRHRYSEEMPELTNMFIQRPNSNWFNSTQR